MVAYTEAERELIPILEARTGTVRVGTAFDPQEEARRIIGHVVCGRIDSSDASTPAELTPEQHKSALDLARRRGSGTPLALLLGQERFLGADYEVAPGVPVPHPATELLALVSLELLANSAAPRVAEIGYGAGQVSIEIARRAPGVEVTASEISSVARELLHRNAERMLGAQADRIRAVTAERPSDVLGVFAGMGGKIDLLVSNPPFLSEIDPISDEVRNHTPAEALYGPDGDPMHFYRVVANDARELLAEGGAVAMEFHEFHRREALWCFQRRSWSVEVVAREDRADTPLGREMRPMRPTGHRVLIARPAR